MEVTDVIIVGAGPIGIELAVALRHAGVEYIHLEAGQIGHTLTWWPRNAQFFSSPERIALCGVPLHTVWQRKVTGEEYLCYLRTLIEQFDLQIRTYERVTSISREGDEFHLRTERAEGTAEYACRRLVLATGGMAKPRRLEIPGEDLPHVSHYFDEPHRYFRRKLLIVGGRNSAAEAAIRCYRAGAEVTMCHRGEDLDYDVIKYWLTPELQGLIRQGRINFLPNVMPISIEPGKVKLTRLHERMVTGEPPFDHPVDFVLLLTGYVADMTLFNMAGVTLIGEEQKPTFDPATMETDVPGLFVAGTAAAGTQSQFKVFIETAHADVEKITRVITGVSVPWSVRAPRSTMPEQ